MVNNVNDAIAYINLHELEYDDAAETFAAMTGQAILATYGSYADMHEVSLSLHLFKPDGTVDDLDPQESLTFTLDQADDQSVRQARKDAFLTMIKASGAAFGMDFSGEAGEQTDPLPIDQFVQVVLNRHIL